MEAFFSDEIERINKLLNPFERIGNFALLSENWSVDAGELTPTLKLRRHFIQDSFAEQIVKMYES